MVLNTANRKIKFLHERPQSTDFFPSKGHSNVAQALAQLIKSDHKGNVIGIQGELGAGKSTIITLCNEMLKAQNDKENENKDKYQNKKYKFAIFNLEQYQHGSLRKSLIKFFSDECKKVLEIKDGKCSEEWTMKTKLALGELHVSEKEEKLKLNYPFFTVIFAISLLLSSRFASKAFDAILSINFSASADYTKISCLILALSPIILALFNTKKLGDLMNKKGKTTTTERTHINNEIDSYELNKAFLYYHDKLEEKSKHIVLVLDNLDRLTKEKVQEVWGDLNVFLNLESSFIKVVLPYSLSYIEQNTLSNNPKHCDITHDFLSKKLPLVLSCPPITEFSWSQYFSQQWNLLWHKSEKDKEFCIHLIEIWYPKEQITPRFLKKLINDIQIHALQAGIFLSKNIENTSNLFIYAAYVIYHNYQGIDLVRILNVSKIEDKKENIIQIYSTRELLNRYQPFYIWHDITICIHYKSDSITGHDLFADELVSQMLTDNEYTSFAKNIEHPNVARKLKIRIRILDHCTYLRLIELLSEKVNFIYQEEFMPIINDTIETKLKNDELEKINLMDMYNSFNFSKLNKKSKLVHYLNNIEKIGSKYYCIEYLNYLMQQEELSLELKTRIESLKNEYLSTT